MKKMISVILALCLACLLLPVLAESAAITDPVGAWTLNRIVSGDTVLSLEDLSQYGASMSVEFRADGTFTDREELGGDASEYSGTWTIDGNTISLFPENADPTQITLEGNELVIPAAGSTIYLVPAVADLAGFDGEYVVSGVSIMGVTMSLADLGMDTTVTLTVQNGTGHLVSTYANGYVWEEDVTMELQDGKLVTSPITMGAGMGSLTMEISAQEDGSLFAVTKIPFNGAELEATFIMVPAEQEAQEPAV